MLNSCGWTNMEIQIGVLIAGILVYVLGTIASMKKSIQQFEVIDLYDFLKKRNQVYKDFK